MPLGRAGDAPLMHGQIVSERGGVEVTVSPDELGAQDVAKRHPKSILLLVASNRRRGAEVFGERLSSGLDELGWSVDFVALQSVQSPRTVTAIPLTDGGGGSRLDLKTVWELRSRIARNRPSLILANGGATLRYAVAAGSMLLARPRLAYASIGEPSFWLRSDRHARVQRFLHRRADVILAVSEMTRRQLVEDLGVGADRVLVAHTGVPPEFFIDGEPSAGELRLLFLGSLSAEKDPQTAIDVAVRLLEDHRVRLRLVGDGPCAADLAKRVEAEALHDVVEITGPVDDVTPHLAWADILLLTSRTEGLPGAVLEAGAAGVPTVGYAVGGTGETMMPGSSGVLVAPGDVAELVAEVHRLAGDAAELSRMGQAARQFVGEHFTLERSIRRYDSILSGSVAAREAR